MRTAWVIQAFHCKDPNSSLINSLGQHSLDDSIIFSMDFPGGHFRNTYRIEREQPEAGFKLVGNRRMCGRDSSLAVTVSSHGPDGLIAVLKKDGNRFDNRKLNYRAYLALSVSEWPSD
jgi:hypothetical protein